MVSLECNLHKTCTSSEFFKEHKNITSPKYECYLRFLKTSWVLVLSKFHEKPSYYGLIIYIQMFQKISLSHARLIFPPFWGYHISQVWESPHYEIQLFSIIVVCIMDNFQKSLFTLFELYKTFYEGRHYPPQNGGFWPSWERLTVVAYVFSEPSTEKVSSFVISHYTTLTAWNLHSTM
jgi:hypothetical protein